MRKSYADMDPTEEIRAIRAEILREFKTLGALCEYLDKKYPMNPSPASPRNGRRAPPKADAPSRKAKATAKQAASRQKVAKRLAHA